MLIQTKSIRTKRQKPSGLESSPGNFAGDTKGEAMTIMYAVKQAVLKYKQTGDVEAGYQMMKGLENKDYDIACAEFDKAIVAKVN